MGLADDGYLLIQMSFVGASHHQIYINNNQFPGFDIMRAPADNS